MKTLKDLINTTESFPERMELIRIALEALGTRLYFAYGSNMVRAQMKRRCPQAIPLKVCRLTGYEFIINPNGVASVIESKNSYVEGLLWEISKTDEDSLDHYEGVSSGLYVKHEIKLDSFTEIPVLVYLGTNQVKANRPREKYFEKILRAGKSIGLDKEYLARLQDYYSRCE